MASRIRIFDHFCQPLTELISIPTTPRSWIRNDVGRCDISLSIADPKCKEQYLQFGNLVHITHIPTSSAHGTLPSWTGIILPPRRWEVGQVNVVAYSIEALLSYRVLPLTHLRGTPKALITSILAGVNRSAPSIPVGEGVIEDKPVVMDVGMRLSAMDHISNIAKDAGMDWELYGSVNNHGKLEIFLNFQHRIGVDTLLQLTNLNSESSGTLLLEDGAPVNRAFAYSQASTPQSRMMFVSVLQDSLNDYGELQGNLVLFGVREQSSVETGANSFTAARGRPRKTVSRVALNVGKTFDYLQPGNTLTVVDLGAGFSPSGGVGFSAQARIISVEYSDMSDKASLNLEVL